METIAVLYKIKEGNVPLDDKYSASFLSIPEGREVLLLDLLQLWVKGGIERICYTFYAEWSGGSRVLLPSPLSLLPIRDQEVRLLLVPAAAPPVIPPDQCGEWLDYSRWQMEHPDSYRVPSGQQPRQQQGARFERCDENKREDVFAPPAVPSRSSNNAQKDIDRGSDHNNIPEGPTREHSIKKMLSTGAVAPKIDETAAALAGAASVASEYTGHAARSLFNFAAKSVKTVANSVASITGHIQVGNHKVMVVKEIAQGGFGIVMLVKDVHDGKQYAMKQMFCQSREQVEEAHLELKTLQQFSGDPNIISLIDYASLPATKGQHRQVLLLFPFFGAGTAWDMIEDAVAAAESERSGDGGMGAHTGQLHWPFPERAALITILGTARGLRTMHDQGVAHRDLKPHNILISDSFSPVIMDLGSVGPVRVEIRSRIQALKAEDEASCKCSAPYRAPELTQVTNECDIDGKIDVWSLGCTMYCLAFGNSPFENSKEGVLKLAILNAKYPVPAGNRNMCGFTYSDGYMDLLHSMLRLHPADRPDMDDVVQHCKELLDTAPA